MSKPRKEYEVPLMFPVEKSAGQMVSSVKIHRPTVGEEEDAIEMALSLGKSRENLLAIEICTYAIITGLKYESLREMDQDDYSAIRRAFEEINAPLKRQEPLYREVTETTEKH